MCVSAPVRQCGEIVCGCTSPGIRSYSPGNNRTLRIACLLPGLPLEFENEVHGPRRHRAVIVPRTRSGRGLAAVKSQLLELGRRKPRRRTSIPRFAALGCPLQAEQHDRALPHELRQTQFALRELDCAPTILAAIADAGNHSAQIRGEHKQRRSNPQPAGRYNSPTLLVRETRPSLPPEPAAPPRARRPAPTTAATPRSDAGTGQIRQRKPPRPAGRRSASPSRCAWPNHRYRPRIDG